MARSSGIRKYAANALVLSAVSLFMRTVAVSFNAYVAGKIGAEGMGLYSLISSVYTFAVTFATSGVNLAVTRLVAEALGRGDGTGAKTAVRKCALYALAFGSAATVLLFCSSAFIGERLLGDARTVVSLRALSLSMLPIALSSVYSGYFTAVRRVPKSAAAGIFEQAVKITVTVRALTLLLPDGLEYACLALVGGGMIAEIASFLFIYVCYLFDKRKLARISSGEPSPVKTGKLLGIALPVAASAYVRSGLVTVEHMLIPYCLTVGGASRGGALASYGILHSMALPIVLYPAAALGSFSGLLIPELAECGARGEKRRIRYITERAITFALVFSIGVAGIILAFSNMLGVHIYSSDEAGKYIGMLAALIPIMYLDTTVDNILKGLGQQVYTMGVNITDSCLCVLLVLILLPPFGAAGYVALLYISEIINFSFSVVRLYNTVGFRVDLLRFLALPLAGIVFSVAAANFVVPGTAVPAMVVKMTLSAIIYFVILFSLGCFDREDRAWMLGLIRGDDPEITRAAGEKRISKNIFAKK